MEHFYDLIPNGGSHYLCLNGQPIARFNELVRAEAVRAELVADQIRLNGVAAATPRAIEKGRGGSYSL